VIQKQRYQQHGYVYIWLRRDDPLLEMASSHGQGGYVLEHRYVMAVSLGRPLTKAEHVHHRNGDRADNRLENLELWTRPRQPRGVRVSDYHCAGCRCFEEAP